MNPFARTPSDAVLYSSKEIQNYGSFAEMLYKGNRQMYQKLVDITGPEDNRKTMENSLKGAFGTLAGLHLKECENLQIRENFHRGGITNTIYRKILSGAVEAEAAVHEQFLKTRQEINTLATAKKETLDADPANHKKKVVEVFKFREEKERDYKSAESKFKSAEEKLSSYEKKAEAFNEVKQNELLLKVSNARSERDAAIENLETAKTNFHSEQLTHEAHVLSYVAMAHSLSAYPVELLEKQLDGMVRVVEILQSKIKDMKAKREACRKRPMYSAELNAHLHLLCHCETPCTAAEGCKREIAVPLRECCKALSNNKDGDLPWIQMEGIFRVGAAQSTNSMIRALFDSDFSIQDFKNTFDAPTQDLEDNNRARGENPVHPFSVADALKTYLRDLEKPLLTPTAAFVGRWRNVYMKHCKNKDEQLFISDVTKIMKEIPMSYKNNAHFLFKFLREVTRYSEDNKMTDSNLATVIMPNLLRFEAHSDGDIAGVETGIDERLRLASEDQQAGQQIFLTIIRNLDTVLPDVDYNLEDSSCESEKRPWSMESAEAINGRSPPRQVGGLLTEVSPSPPSPPPAAPPRREPTAGGPLKKPVIVPVSKQPVPPKQPAPSPPIKDTPPAKPRNQPPSLPPPYSTAPTNDSQSKEKFVDLKKQLEKTIPPPRPEKPANLRNSTAFPSAADDYEEVLF